jgi:hypothetical protein
MFEGTSSRGKRAGLTFATPMNPITWMAATTKLRIARIHGAEDGVTAPTTGGLSVLRKDRDIVTDWKGWTMTRRQPECLGQTARSM